jgi:hypothetical protein
MPSRYQPRSRRHSGPRSSGSLPTTSYKLSHGGAIAPEWILGAFMGSWRLRRELLWLAAAKPVLARLLG